MYCPREFKSDVRRPSVRPNSQISPTYLPPAKYPWRHVAPTAPQTNNLSAPRTPTQAVLATQHVAAEQTDLGKLHTVHQRTLNFSLCSSPTRGMIPPNPWDRFLSMRAQGWLERFLIRARIRLEQR